MVFCRPITLNPDSGNKFLLWETVFKQAALTNINIHISTSDNLAPKSYRFLDTFFSGYRPYQIHVEVHGPLVWFSKNQNMVYHRDVVKLQPQCNSKIIAKSPQPSPTLAIFINLRNSSCQILSISSFFSSRYLCKKENFLKLWTQKCIEALRLWHWKNLFCSIKSLSGESLPLSCVFGNWSYIQFLFTLN